MPSSPREHFLLTIGQWEYSVPLQTQWIMTISPIGGGSIPGLLKNIGADTTLDKNGFAVPPIVQQTIFSERVQPNADGIGLIYIQKINIPGESISPVEAGVENQAGFLKGTAGGDRQGINNRQLSTEVLETNLDFIDGIIRPWIITAGYRGLLARTASESIKCNIQIVQFTRTDGIKARPVRKVHNFFNCVPTGIEQLGLSYIAEDVNIRTVNWTFTSYTYKIKE
jgi:hypothetical protein